MGFRIHARGDTYRRVGLSRVTMAMMLLPQTSAQARRWARTSLTDQGSAADRRYSRGVGRPRVACSTRSGVCVKSSRIRRVAWCSGFMLPHVAPVWAQTMGCPRRPGFPGQCALFGCWQEAAEFLLYRVQPMCYSTSPMLVRYFTMPG